MSTFNWIIIILLVVVVGMAMYESYQFSQTGRGQHYYGMDEDSGDGLVDDGDYDYY